MAGFRDSTRDSQLQDGDVLAERVDALAAWISELEAQVRASTAVADPGTLKELAKALDAWSKHDPKLEDRMTNRVDVLADRLTTLSGTVNATAAALAGKDGDIASLRKELEQGTARIETVLQELRQSGSSAEIAELRKSIAALPADGRSRAGDSHADMMPSDAQALAQRIDTLAVTVATTAAGLAGREGALAALRRNLETGGARLEGVVGELRNSFLSLSSQLAALDERTSGSERVPALEQRLDELRRIVDSLGERVASTATGVQAAAEGLSDKELELAAIHRHFEEASTRVDTMKTELERALASMPAPGSVDPVVGDRLDSLGRHVEVQGEQLARLESLAPAPATQAAYEELQPRLDQLATRLEAGERRREAVAAEVARASQAWESQRAELRAELQDELAALARSAATRETAATGFDRVVAELAARVEAVERSELESAAGIARTVGTWESRLGEMEARLAEAAALGAEPVQDAATDGLLAEIAGRLDTLETDRDAGEMGRLRVLVDGVRMRLASSEKELAALAGSHEVVARLDELTWRLDSLENAGVGPASSLLPPVAGDGRFRVELRGLELRMEHAEAAARENREAVLTQLERLASRIEWRLQRLESANAGALSQPQAVEAPLGQVVPIRGEA